MSSTTSNLFKSEAGWARYRERTQSGAKPHRMAMMDHRTREQIAEDAAKAKSKRARKAIDPKATARVNAKSAEHRLGRRVVIS